MIFIELERIIRFSTNEFRKNLCLSIGENSNNNIDRFTNFTLHLMKIWVSKI